MMTSVLRFYAVQALLRSVAPIIKAEEGLGGKAVSEGWANVGEKELEKCLKADQESLRSKLREVWDNTYDEEYARLFRRVSTHHLLLRLHALLRPPSAFGISEESQIRRD